MRRSPTTSAAVMLSSTARLVCLDADGRSNFYRLLFRRDWPSFHAFDVLSVEVEDVQDRPLILRKRILHRLMPRVPSRLLCVDHLEARGTDLFRAASAFDLEGVVAKWGPGAYQRVRIQTSWIKIKNAAFHRRRGGGSSSSSRPPRRGGRARRS